MGRCLKITKEGTKARGHEGTKGAARIRGFTLVESLLAVSILAFAVTAVVAAVNVSRSHSTVSGDNSQALSLARQLMEEIIAKPFNDPNAWSVLGPDGGETSRALFDNADDYHGFTDTTATLNSEDGTAVALAEPRGYSRQVRFEYRASPSGAAIAMGDFGLVTVSVADSTGRKVHVSQLLTRVVLNR